MITQYTHHSSLTLAASEFCNWKPYISYSKFKKLEVEFEFVVSGGDGSIKGGGFSSSLISPSTLANEEEAEPGCRRYSSEEGFISATAA